MKYWFNATFVISWIIGAFTAQNLSGNEIIMGHGLYLGFMLIVWFYWDETYGRFFDGGDSI